MRTQTPTSNNILKISKSPKDINVLLFSDCVKTSTSNIQLILCSSDIKVIINKTGGVCTKCRKFFKSDISLNGHLSKCLPDKCLPDKCLPNKCLPIYKNVTLKNSKYPKLVIV